MDKSELIKKILDNMEYMEEIRGGIWKCKDETYQDLYFEAHQDMLPDDWRYKMIHDSLIALGEVEEGYDVMEALDSHIPIYTHELMAWMGSRNDRYSYVDQAIEDFGKADSIINDIMAGYLKELEEVYYSVDQWIDEHVDEDL
jgi:hypothetical protein